MKAISVSGSFFASQPATAWMCSGSTVTPSSQRSRFSSRIFIE